jgi:hypothetical protein
MKKLDLIKEISFGNQIAEEEKDTLAEYFVKTNSWKKIFDGEVDIVYGPKGAGKSAIYVLVHEHANALAEQGIILVPGENLRGSPAFSTLIPEPPSSERQFSNLWNLYFLSLIGKKVAELKLRSKPAKELLSHLEASDLLLPTSNFAAILKKVKDYVAKYSNPKSLETGIDIDAASGGVKGITGKIVFEDPGPDARRAGCVSVADLFALASNALKPAEKKIWLLLDRLDVAFDETADLEKNALRALFRVYRDLRQYDNIFLKIFLRSDIWERVSEAGFREASHNRET